MDIDVVRGVLAQPTRARLLGLLEELGAPASTAELAQALDLHPNGVRLHLERMADAGILVRGVQQPPRGRPRDVWSVSPEMPAGDPPTAYADLGKWLARALGSGTTGLDLVEASGRAIGRDLAERVPDGTVAERLRDAFATLGFQPVKDVDDQQELTFTLHNCPYREAVKERPQIVCGLHRGITRGVLEVLSPELNLADFVPNDPDRAGCLVRMRPDVAPES